MLAAVLTAAALLAASVIATSAMRPRSDRELALSPSRTLVTPVPARRPTAPASRETRAEVVSPTWVRKYAGRTGIPPRALQAYADAVLHAPCHIGWTTLAGVGWVESEHGITGGQGLVADGRPLVPILGPVLDGRGDVGAMRNRDGDWQRAEGPMQFLPSTWERWSSDGDDDGVADPQDIDDAAYAAARYLCASGEDLATGAGWSAAIRSYNHSDDYVRAVYAASAAYTDRAE
jgi:hypothetical protein